MILLFDKIARKAAIVDVGAFADDKLVSNVVEKRKRKSQLLVVESRDIYAMREEVKLLIIIFQH